MSIKRARELGAEDGAECVDVFVRDEGLEQLPAACAPGQPGWDEGAINARAHEHTAERALGRGFTGAEERAYYKAYAKAADERAAELLAEEP